MGVVWVSGAFGCGELEEVSNAERFVEESEFKEAFPGGEGAIVVDLKITAESGESTGR
jgi:hypothetical protein